MRIPLKPRVAPKTSPTNAILPVPAGVPSQRTITCKDFISFLFLRRVPVCQGFALLVAGAQSMLLRVAGSIPRLQTQHRPTKHGRIFAVQSKEQRE